MTEVEAVRVTAVVVTWNSARHVDGCLAALLAQDHPVDVVVVDNGSTDDTVDRVMAVGGESVRLLREPTNTGFCAAVNRGIAESDSDAVLLVNPDARLAIDHVRHLATALQVDPGLGSVQGTLWRPDHGRGPRLVDSTGHRAFVARLWANRDEGATAPSDGGEVAGVTGAAALHRRAMLDDVAFRRRDGTREWLDETLFAYWDDVDLDWRARLRGWRAAHVPAAVGVHERGGARARRSALVEELNAANRLLVLVKLDDRGDALRHAPAIVGATLLKLLWLGLASPRVLPRVVGRFVRNLRPIRARRRAALATATVTPAEAASMFERFDAREWVRRWWRRVRRAAPG